MNQRKSFIVGVVSLAITAGVCVCSTCKAEELGIDFWHMGELEQQIARCETTRAALEEEDQIVLRRMACRQIMLKNLIARRITLDEAIKGFDALNKESTVSMSALAITYRDLNELDLARNQVLDHLKMCHLPGGRERFLELSNLQPAH